MELDSFFALGALSYPKSFIFQFVPTFILFAIQSSLAPNSTFIMRLQGFIVVLNYFKKEQFDAEVGFSLIIMTLYINFLLDY